MIPKNKLYKTMLRGENERRRGDGLGVADALKYFVEGPCRVSVSFARMGFFEGVRRPVRQGGGPHFDPGGGQRREDDDFV